MCCGIEIQVFVPKGWDYKEITVKCGNTSPTGDPWLCEDCEEKHRDTNWRARAESFGERYEEDY